MELPRYKCHKEVRALKISGIRAPAPEMDEGQRLIIPAEPGYEPFEVSGDYMRKHTPQVGGYYVVYDDGYTSFSPADAFEDGYTRIPTVAPASAQPF